MFAKRGYRPTLELLEDRTVPAVFQPWPDARHLTLSFMPDGTQIGTATSNLFQTLDALAPRAAWQREIVRAFQTWAAVANVEIGLVQDYGEAAGTGTNAQGDLRFGDIRIGAYVQSANVLATNTPYDPAATGSWTGDVFLNSRFGFSVGGQGGPDLFTVFLDEAANVLGLPDSTDPASARYGSYVGAKGGLTAQDASDLQALYGAKDPDAGERYDPKAKTHPGNDTPDRATPITLPDGFDRSAPLTVGGVISTGQDVDYYAFKTLKALDLSSDGVTIRLRTAGVSQLQGRLSVYDRAGNLVATAQDADPLSGDLSIQLTSPTASANYTIRVDGVPGAGVFGVGAYQLEVDYRPLAVQASMAGFQQALRGSPVAAEAAETQADQIWLTTDGNSNDRLDRATPLSPDSYFAANSHYQAVGSLTEAADVDVYKAKAPAFPKEQAYTLAVTLKSLDGSSPVPAVSVYDKDRHLVNATVTVSGGGVLTVQVASPLPGADYFVLVQRPAGAAAGSPDYLLTAQFNELGGNDPSTAVKLAAAQGYTPNSHYEQKAILASATDQDYFLVRSRKVAQDQPNVLLASLKGRAGDRPDAVLTVYQKVSIDGKTQYVAVPGQVLVSTGGRYVLQLANVKSDQDYYVGVAAVAPHKALAADGSTVIVNPAVGNYRLVVDFRDDGLTTQTLATQALTAGQADAAQTLTVDRDALFRFALSVDTGGAAVDTATRMLIYDANGNVVFQLGVAGSGTRSGEVTLAAGTYTIRFVARTWDASQALPPINVTLSGLVMNDPIGPTLLDPTGQPVGSTAPTVTIKPTISPSMRPWLGLVDALSNPWYGL
jgi:hypothetical protein